MKIMLAAGEPSGDLHGSKLAVAIRKKNPHVHLFGLGGPLMASSGVELFEDPTSMSFIGFAEVVSHFRFLLKLLHRTAGKLKEERPDAIVFIDFPGFNMRLAKTAKDMGVPSVYYFSPSAWAWRRGRAKKVAGLIDLVASVFPFEASVYQEAGANVEYVGHPLLDAAHPSMGREEVYRFLNIDPDALQIALMPGSRQQEVESLFGIMLEAARLIQANSLRPVQYLVPVAASIDDALIRGFVANKGCGLNLRLVHGYQYDLLSVADLALIGCGTATLEAALFQVPMVTMYRLSRITYHIAKILVQIPHVALPNIIAGKCIVPELIQHDVTAPNIAHEAVQLLQGAKRERQIHELRRVRELLGPPGAVERCADVVLNLAAGARCST
jgi:lipid-A-disaccharide synthase